MSSYLISGKGSTHNKLEKDVDDMEFRGWGNDGHLVPATGKVSYALQQWHLKIVFGFGFINTTKEYKVLRCVYSKLRISEVNVYTVGTGSWKTVDVVLLHEAQDIWKEVPYANGNLHWSGVCDDIRKIISFDLEKEKFQNLSWSDYDADYNLDCVTLGVFEGQLSMFHDVMSSRVEIWSMKDYGVKESWTKLFSIAHPGVLDPYDCVVKPLTIRKNGDVLVHMNNKDLFSYCRTRNGIVEYHNVHGIPNWFLKRYSYVETLTSIASMMIDIVADE
ncbi:hypothetical protein GIB67_014469, partial [Kingdonia uniflora]